MPRLLILSTPRTGSNALCEVLTFAGSFGHVDGFFIGYGDGIKGNAASKSEHNLTDHAASDGHVATKIMWDYLDHIAEREPGFVPDWLNSFTHILKVGRRDKVAQAVSWFMALGSGKWTSVNERKRDWPEYDYNKIAHLIGMVHGHEARTECFISTSGLPRMNLYYEDMCEDWPMAASQILDFCGLSLTGQLRDPELVKQVNPLKAEYIRAYQHDFLDKMNHRPTE